MRHLILSALVAMIALPDRPAPVQPTVSDDLAKLDGTWAVVSYEYDGGKLAPNQVATYPRLIIHKGTYRWTTGEVAYGMKIDPTKTPKLVEYTLADKLYLGIYELQGDIFRDCIAPPGRDRPLDFTVPPGSGRMYFVYRRVKD